MEGVIQLEQPSTSKRKRSSTIDFYLCVLCQCQLKEALVKNSKSTQKLLDALRIRNECNDSDYKQIAERLESATTDELNQCNTRWHLSCYKKCTHKGNLDRLQAKFKKLAENEDAGETSVNRTEFPCTRSQRAGSQLQKTTCFFCDKPEAKRHPLHTVSTEVVGQKLYDAVQLSENNQWKLKLSGCIDPKDGHAYDIAYHKECFIKNVFNVLRGAKKPPESNLLECESQVEFIDCLLEALLEGKVVTMSDAERVFKEICTSNGVKAEDMITRKSLKTLIENELFDMDVVFSNPVSKNQSQRISLKSVNDAVLSHAEGSSNKNENMKALYQAAKVLRKAILKEEKWTFSGVVTQENVTEAIPQEVLSFFKWCIGGRKMFDGLMVENVNLNRKVSALSQTLMYECLTDRQVSYGTLPSVKSRHTRELPLQVAVGLTIHSKTRSKFLVQLMHGLGSSIDYNKVLRLETGLANEVIRRMEGNGGIYVPPNLVKGRFMYCAADNLDFLEDTRDGKGTLHATVMTCYQEHNKNDESQSVTLCDASMKSRSLENLPCYMTNFISYNGPKLLKPKSTVFKESDVNSTPKDLKSLKELDLAWCLCKATRIPNSTSLNVESTDSPSRTDDDTMIDTQNQPKETSSHPDCVPTWPAFNATMQDIPKPITRICVLPIIPATPTDRSIQLTFLTHLENLTKHICGTASKCVVTLDLGLYRPVQQLIMSQKCLQDRFVLRPGELHICMALLRAIGTFIDGSGIPELWDVWYSESTVQQIINGKHVRRAVEAHKRTLVALYSCYLEEFFKKYPCAEMVNKVLKTKCFERRDIQELLAAIKECNLSKKMEEFDNVQGQSNPTFKMMREYMAMVESLLQLIRSVRNGDWNAHISSVHAIIGYFFALDLRNYSGMMAYYLSEMSALKESDPAIWEEFEKGNWVVRKTTTPFCALGADEALEHENRALKVTGGLVGITQHPRALARYFLTAPLLDQISQEASIMAGVQENTASLKHHYDSREAVNKEDIVIHKLHTELGRVGNPFSYTGPELVNIATKAVFDDNIKKDVGRFHALGIRLHDEFKTQRLVSETSTMNVWDPLKMNKLNLCSNAKKKIKLKIAGTVKELRADRSLFARLLVVSRSQRQVDLRDTLGTYEFSAVPRSLFNADGTMHLCQQKSKLIEILRSIPSAPPSPPQSYSSNYERATAATTAISNTSIERNFSVGIVDGMAELQALEKSKDIKTCKDLAEAFSKKIEKKYWEYDEVHLVFDTYTDNSIKSMTRQKRLQGTAPTHYKIMDSTNIANLTMKKLLSHTSTKDELTAYLAQKTLQHAQVTNKDFVVAWRTEVASSHCSLDYLRSTQEEADTKMILHALNAKERGAAKLFIFAQDTDVLILLIRRYPKLPLESFFVPNSKNIISIADIFVSLGSVKASALPAFHALSGSDTTGTLSGKGKISYWKAFSTASEDTLLALTSLGTHDTIPEEVIDKIETFICQVYQPTTSVTNLADLRWLLFSKKQTSWEKLPPTRSAFVPAIQRVNYQAMIWNQDDEAQPTIPSPIGHGWNIEDGQIAPVLCEMPCAPDSILQLIRCSCVKNRCSAPCKCLANNLPCTDMCECGGNDELCDNHFHNELDVTDSGSEDELAEDDFDHN